MVGFKLILLLVIFLTPLVGIVGEYGYEESKVLLFLFLVTLAGVIWVMKRSGESKILPNRINLASGVLITVIGLSSLLGANPLRSLVGQAPYYQGYLLYIYLFLFSLLLTKSGLKINLAAGVLTAAALIVSLLALKDWTLLNLGYSNIPLYNNRVVSSFGQPNFYAGFILLVLPLSFYILTKLKSRLLALELLLIEVGGILVSRSKTALLLLVILISAWLLSRLTAGLRGFFLGFVLAVILCAGLFSVYIQSGPLWEELDQPNRLDWFNHQFPIRGFYFWQFGWSKNPEKRFYIWPVIGELVLKKPLLGYGPANLEQSISSSYLASFNGIKDLNIDNAHNFFLDMLVNFGVLGLLGYLLLLILLFKNSHHQGLSLSLVIYLIWSFFQNQSIVHLIFFWTMVGLVQVSYLDRKIK